jgi:aspartate/methionine/tyrosine aminotransferase
MRAPQCLPSSTPPARQWAVAEGLTLPDAWFAAERAGWAASRARLKRGLTEGGYVVLPNAATWFLCVDLAASGVALDDRMFGERALHEAGVASIPVSALFEGEGPRHVVRFCFTKADATLDEAAERLAGFREKLL